MVTIADHLIHGDHYDLYLMVIHVWQPPPPPDPNALYAYYWYVVRSSKITDSKKTMGLIHLFLFLEEVDTSNAFCLHLLVLATLLACS